MPMPISALLHIEKGLTAFIGAGGKSALIARLSGELPGKVILCSTGFYYPYKNTAFLSISDNTPEKEEEMLRALLAENHAVCAGEMVGNGKLGAPVTSFARLKELADYVLVEADDARGLPIKAHKTREPVLPDACDDIICVIGASGFMKPVEEAVHHPEIFRLLTGCAKDALCKPELVARAHLNENLTSRVMINQVETKEALALAERFVNATDFRNIIVGSVAKNAYKRYA